MSSSFRRPLLTLTAATGGLLAALSSAAIANADEWVIAPSYGTLPDILSESGYPPFYKSVLEQGLFSVTDNNAEGTDPDYLAVPGLYSSTASMGMSNVDFIAHGADNGYAEVPNNSVIDIFTMGNFQNQYVDLVGLGSGGSNQITDTLITPFGDYNISTTFDAAAFGSTSLPAEAAAALPAAEAAASSGVTAYTITPQFEDAETSLTSVGGIEPFYQTADYSGGFTISSGAGDDFGVGHASYFSDLLGMHNVLFQGEYNNAITRIIDDLNFGHGYDMVYTDYLGTGPDGANSITDTLVTPFGDINIPTTFDAIAEFPTTQITNAAESVAGLAGATDWLAALDADWTTLVSDFSALF